MLVLVFFITSSDSGSLVVDSITAGGLTEAPAAQRLFWACTEGGIAIALPVGGGSAALGALQAGAVSTGLPFHHRAVTDVCEPDQRPEKRAGHSAPDSGRQKP